MKKSTIYREDAIDAVHKYFNDAINNEPRGINKDGYDVFTDAKSVNALLYHNKMVSKALSALPSAEVVSREDYHNLLMASNDIDRALREYQAKEEQLSVEAEGTWLTEYTEEEAEKEFPNIAKYNTLEPLIKVGSTQVEKCENCIYNGANKDKMTCKECASVEVKSKWNCTANFIVEQLERLKDMTDEERLKLLQTIFPPVEADDKFYIKVYVDDNPQDKAEKLYQICDGNEALSEVAKCIQRYFDEPSVDYKRAIDQMEHDIIYESMYNQDDGSM